MTRRRSPRRSPPRQPSRTATASVDPIAVYRDAAGYGRLMRTALALGLLLLCASLVVEVAGATPRPEIGAAGLLAMLLFISAGVAKHYRGLYRVRRHHPEAWRADAAFIRGMMLAPFGFGDPRATRYDRWLRLTTIVLAVALVGLVLGRGGGRH